MASKTVAAQFSSQLRELRSRIDTTVPHYIRCLKPNDELVPNYFDPKMIVEQLRCGGVLEAVRVSRAGYSTRYPHDVFQARYSFLGDREIRSSKTMRTNTPFGMKLNAVKGDNNSIKKLIGKIALDIWEAENKSKDQQKNAAPVEVSLVSKSWTVFDDAICLLSLSSQPRTTIATARTNNSSKHNQQQIKLLIIKNSIFVRGRTKELLQRKSATRVRSTQSRNDTSTVITGIPLLRLLITLRPCRTATWTHQSFPPTRSL